MGVNFKPGSKPKKDNVVKALQKAVDAGKMDALQPAKERKIVPGECKVPQCYLYCPEGYKLGEDKCEKCECAKQKGKYPLVGDGKCAKDDKDKNWLLHTRSKSIEA